MTTPTLVPVDEYLATTYRPDRDYVDGVLMERNVGEYIHSRTQSLLNIYIGIHEKQWAVRVVPEQRVQVKSARFRVPDLCVIKDNAPVEPIFTRPPLLCIEILSKDDRMSDMQERIHDYLSFGVAWVWVVDPSTRRAYVYTAAAMQEVNDGVLRAGDSNITVPVAAIFE